MGDCVIDISFFKIFILSLVQGAAEILPISSSAHVILAELGLGLDPSSPEMIYVLVMLHTGTMLAVLWFYRQKAFCLDRVWIKNLFLATLATGTVGGGLKKGIEWVVLVRMHQSFFHVEDLFKNLTVMSVGLFAVGVLILWSGFLIRRKPTQEHVSTRSALCIGMVQGLCLPFRGFSRSGSTISTALLLGISRSVAQDFSFALMIVLTPGVIVLGLYRWMHAQHYLGWTSLMPGFLGLILSFLVSYWVLSWFSRRMHDRGWKYFGFYCILLSVILWSVVR